MKKKELELYDVKGLLRLYGLLGDILALKVKLKGIKRKKLRKERKLVGAATVRRALSVKDEFNQQ